MKLYRKKNTTPMTPWNPASTTDGVSISQEDIDNGSPKPGDMIAHNPENVSDCWLVSKEYFEANYEEAT